MISTVIKKARHERNNLKSRLRHQARRGIITAFCENAITVRIEKERPPQAQRIAPQPIVTEQGEEKPPQASQGACTGLCRREGKFIFSQPDCPAHGIFERYDPLFARKPQSFTAVETEVV